MSTPEDTDSRKVDVPLPTATWGRAEALTECAGAKSVTAEFSPAREWTYGSDNQYSSTIPADVAVKIGDMRISLEPQVWAVVIAAVQQVLPEQSPAIQELLAQQAADLCTYTACEGADAEQVNA